MARRTAEDAARTREAILDVGLHVFAERGFAGAQLEDIARRADVTRGAFYHHFTNKADLYLAILQERWDTVMAPLLQQLRGRRKPATRLHAFVVAFIEAVRSDPRMKSLMEMSLSGDVKLPEFQSGMADKSAALEALDRRGGARAGGGGSCCRRARPRDRAGDVPQRCCSLCVPVPGGFCPRGQTARAARPRGGSRLSTR